MNLESLEHQFDPFIELLFNFRLCDASWANKTSGERGSEQEHDA